jgi:hypothetical protein
MAKKPTAADDPVEEARAGAEKRRTDFAAEQEELERKLDAIREEGRLQRERDQAEHDKAVLAEAEAAAKAREKTGEEERKAMADLFKQARAAKAEHDAKVDAEFAAALAARLEAEKDTDPSIGPQVTLEPDSMLARAARGGAAPDMAGNALAAEQAQIAAGAAS